MYELAANLTLIIHLVFIIFVVFGALLFFASTKIIYIHFPALVWGIYMELSHSICFLTYFENWFLYKANLTTYPGGFIQNYIVPIVYPSDLTEDSQTMLAIALLLINVIIYSFFVSDYKKRMQRPPTN